MEHEGPELHRREARLRRARLYRAAVMAYGNPADMEAPELLYLKFEMQVLDDRHTFAQDAPPVTVRLGAFECELGSDRMLTATPLEHFPGPDEGEMSLRPHLGRWEAYSELAQAIPIRFDLRHWAVVNRHPNPKGSVNCVASVSDLAMPTDQSVVQHPSLPLPPPESFTHPEGVEILRERWRDVIEFRALPAVEGYFTLTLLESVFSGRSAAADTLRIDRRVLNMLGAITVAADPLRGRKAHGEHRKSVRGRTGPLGPDEEQWLVALAQQVMLRLADPGFRGTRLRMDDLPPLGGGA